MKKRVLTAIGVVDNRLEAARKKAREAQKVLADHLETISKMEDERSVLVMHISDDRPPFAVEEDEMYVTASAAGNEKVVVGKIASTTKRKTDGADATDGRAGPKKEVRRRGTHAPVLTPMPAWAGSYEGLIGGFCLWCGKKEIACKCVCCSCSGGRVVCRDACPAFIPEDAHRKVFDDGVEARNMIYFRRIVRDQVLAAHDNAAEIVAQDYRDYTPVEDKVNVCVICHSPFLKTSGRANYCNACRLTTFVRNALANVKSAGIERRRKGAEKSVE